MEKEREISENEQRNANFKVPSTKEQQEAARRGLDFMEMCAREEFIIAEMQQDPNGDKLELYGRTAALTWIKRVWNKGNDQVMHSAWQMASSLRNIGRDDRISYETQRTWEWCILYAIEATSPTALTFEDVKEKARDFKLEVEDAIYEYEHSRRYTEEI